MLNFTPGLLAFQDNKYFVSRSLWCHILMMYLQASLVDVQGIFLCGGCLLAVATATFIMEIFWKHLNNLMHIPVYMIRQITIF